ncbi:MAG: molybdopterin-dependent oxidoreductase [Dehalococcoidia bacterium]|nr:molybdopterin-dependent oxidoreductase [Dehalococcoidia bacterium]
MPDEITLQIDGNEIKTQRGKTIIQAAMDAGLYIPYLCYYPGMKAFGACRMCVVEVENARGTPASCTTPAAEGMVVWTKTDQIQDTRKGIMELVVSEHPHGCLTCHRIELCGPQDICLRHVGVTDRCVACPKNERCELKDTTQYIGMDLTTPLTYKYRNLPVENKDPFYDLDYNLCIVCGRCVRACEELRVDSAITFTERAGVSLVGPSQGLSLLESGCEFCGSCIDVCPVGALVEREYKWEKATDRVSTTCSLCPVGCQLKLEVNKRGKVIRAIPELDAAANHGQACFKGKFGFSYVNSRARITTPLIRHGDALQEATWEEAIAYISHNLSNYVGDKFAALASHRGTNEENYLVQKFTRSVMQTNNVDHPSNTKSAMAEVLRAAIGYRAATNPIWDLENSPCIMAISTNVTEEHNVLSVPIKRAAKNGSELIVIDSREVELTRYATEWMRPKPGTDGILIGGIIRVIVDEVLEDQEFISSSCVDIEEMKKSLWQYDLSKVENITGIKQDDIRSVARKFAASDASSIVYALDTIPDSHVEEFAKAVINLSLVTGNIGKRNGGIYPLTSGTNDQGSWDVGCVPNYLPGYRSITDESASEVSSVWGAEIPSTDGLGVIEMFDAIDKDTIKAMLIVGDNPAYYNGLLGNVSETLKKLDFLVVQDTFLSGITSSADVVLPSVTFAEKEGTYTNLERRVQPLVKILEVPNSQAMPDWWIIAQIAYAMQGQGFEYHCPSEILDEISGLVTEYTGISYSRLISAEVNMPIGIGASPLPSQMLPASSGTNNGIQWPLDLKNNDGTEILHEGGFKDSKAAFSAMVMQDNPSLSNKEYPFIFLPGRILHDPQREIKIELNGRRNAINREELLGVHPSDASGLGVSDGDWVEVTSASETMRARASLNDKVYPGTVSATFLFGELATALDSSDEPDPMSNVPTLLPSAVKLIKV